MADVKVVLAKRERATLSQANEEISIGLLWLYQIGSRLIGLPGGRWIPRAVGEG